MTADAKACVILLVCGASVISVVQTDTNKAVRIKFEDRHLRRFVSPGLDTDTQRVSISSGEPLQSWPAVLTRYVQAVTQ